MKLVHFKQLSGYLFMLTFQNGKITKTDLMDLINCHVKANELDTARINSEWGCLEFKGGMVDIEPKTLYNYATTEDKLTLV